MQHLRSRMRLGDDMRGCPCPLNAEAMQLFASCAEPCNSLLALRLMFSSLPQYCKADKNHGPAVYAPLPPPPPEFVVVAKKV